jgi:hypothetical protein
MPNDARARLAAEQERLVQCLTAGGATPQGFDAGQVATAAQALMRKRSRGVARTWPALAKSLGDDFEDLFARYAASQAQPTGGYLEDGEQFAQWLNHHAAFPNGGRIEWLSRRAMRGWPIKVGSGAVGGWIVALRIWRQGVRVWTIRLR